jgi:coatomer subunit beta'
VFLQRDVVVSYLDGGKRVDEEGVEDAFELLHEVNERVRTGLWVGDCFIYNNSSWRLNYCVGGEVKIVYSSTHASSVNVGIVLYKVHLFTHL